MAFFWYVDALIFRDISEIRMLFEGIFAIVIAEFIVDFFKSKFYY